MSGLNQTVFYAVVMLVVGIGIPIFAALNGGLATRLNHPMLASTVALVAAICVIVSALLLTQGLPRLKIDSSIPVWFYFGGVFVAIYILGMTWVAPRFGVGNAVAFVLLGQLISMARNRSFRSIWSDAEYRNTTAHRWPVDDGGGRLSFRGALARQSVCMTTPASFQLARSAQLQFQPVNTFP